MRSLGSHLAILRKLFLVQQRIQCERHQNAFAHAQPHSAHRSIATYNMRMFCMQNGGPDLNFEQIFSLFVLHTEPFATCTEPDRPALM